MCVRLRLLLCDSIHTVWIHHDTDLDFYDLTSSSGLGPDGNPVISYTLPTGSSCSQATTFAQGNQFITYHGDVPFCTCKWTEDNRCPHKVEITIPGSAPQQLDLGKNSVLNIDTISPDVVASAALGYDDDDPLATGDEGTNDACAPLVPASAAAVAGKYCVVDRGGCLFQTKYENCREAGAIGTIIVNRNDGVIVLPVFQVDEGDPLVMVGSSDGDIIKAAIDDVTISIGRGTGPPQPTAGFTEPDAMGSINAWTGENIVTSAPFLLANDALIDYRRNLMYAIDIDGNKPSQTMVLDLSAPNDAGQYPAVGVFDQAASSTYWDILYQDDKVYLLETNWVDSLVYVWDATDDPAAPTQIATIEYDGTWCPRDDRPMRLSGVEVHPDMQYIYLLPGGRTGDCPNDDDYLMQVWDMSDPSMPSLAGTFPINEVDVGSSFVQVNGLTWTWGRENIAALPMASSGLVFYDFSDPLMPEAITDAYDPTANQDDFTRGIYDTVYGDNNYWITYEKDGIDGVHGIWHALRLVCDE